MVMTIEGAKSAEPELTAPTFLRALQRTLTPYTSR
ncbi:MAG: hypothetical protein JWN00_5554 [Actinomycetia bacterium]|jgi:hypothetical protein|nr:hypothetical protein [Actinomycetes bacterium]